MYYNLERLLIAYFSIQLFQDSFCVGRKTLDYHLQISIPLHLNQMWRVILIHIELIEVLHLFVFGSMYGRDHREEGLVEAAIEPAAMQGMQATLDKNETEESNQLERNSYLM